MKRPLKIKNSFLIAACLVALGGVVLVFLTSKTGENAYASVQYRAAVRMEKAEEYMKKEILSKGIAIEPEDINRTGLLGPEFTELTSTPGSVDAKRTSLDPNFAAAMVKYFHEAGLKKGDKIAVGSSGSFPGFLIAVLTAGTEMGLDIKVIASLGSSMHGATRPDYNIFDIMHALQNGGFANFEVLEATPGGSNDSGGGVLEGVIYTGTKELSQKLCLESGWKVPEHKDLAENIKERLSLYGNDVKLFVNVGGAGPNCGTSSYTLNFPQGLVVVPPTIPTTPYRGLNYEFAARGVPVLNLLNVKLLARQNGIPYDSVPLSSPGKSRAYYRIYYSVPIMLIVISLVAILLIVGYIRNREH